MFSGDVVVIKMQSEPCHKNNYFRLTAVDKQHSYFNWGSNNFNVLKFNCKAT
jgi:hypothetical protein